MKITVRGLSDELNIVKEQIKVIEALEKKIEENEREIIKLKEKDHLKNTETFKCNTCAKPFSSRNLLRKHVAVGCKSCKDRYQKNHELDTLREKEHKVEKKFKSDICSKCLYLEWRFRKHSSVHSENTRSCKYFYMKQFCSFKQIGCMLKHAESEEVTKDPIGKQNITENIETEYYVEMLSKDPHQRIHKL